MPKKLSWILPALTICALLTLPVLAQEQQQRAAKPDSPEVLAHIEKAKKIAGTYWAKAELFLCYAPVANPATAPGPVKLFDNLWAIPGQYSVGNAVTYVLPTSAGIMMIDPGHAKDVESVLLPGLKPLGLDPANIKVVIAAHGHEDHYGGAAPPPQPLGRPSHMPRAGVVFST